MFFFFKQKTAYEIKECDWSSDVCSSDLLTKEELYWIERTADIESALAMDKFVNLCKINPKDMNKKQIEQLAKISEELIDVYGFLKNLRIKMEIERKR